MSVGMAYTSTVEGSAVKVVICEQCGQDYVYIVTRKATGEGSSVLFLDNSGAQRRAQDRAMKTLQAELDKAIEPVPCVSCGWLQQDMVREARKRYHRWMTVTGAILTLVGAIVLVITAANRDMSRLPAVWAAGAVVLAGGIALLVIRAMMLSNYDANASQEQANWATLSAGMAMTGMEYEAIIAERDAEHRAADQAYDDLTIEPDDVVPQQGQHQAEQVNESDALQALRAAQQGRR